MEKINTWSHSGLLLLFWPRVTFERLILMIHSQLSQLLVYFFHAWISLLYKVQEKSSLAHHSILGQAAFYCWYVTWDVLLISLRPQLPLPGIQPSCSIPACFLITPPLAFFKVSWAETISFFHPQASWDYLSLTQFFATTVLVMFVCFVLFFFFFWSAPRSTYWIWEVCILFS